MTLEDWSRKLMALIIGVLAEKILNKDTIIMCIEGLMCGLLGVISFLGMYLIRKSNNSSHRVRWRLILAVFIFASIIGGTLGNFLYPWLGWAGTVLVTIIISSNIQNLPHVFNWGVAKSMINSFVSIVKREKITDDEIRPTISAGTRGKNNKGGSNSGKT